jgi:hypothetical protein
LVATTPAAAATFAAVFTAASREDNNFGPNSLGNRIQLAPADVGPEELQVAALYADDGKAGPASSLAHVAAFPNKNLSHFFAPVQKIMAICPK